MSRISLSTDTLFIVSTDVDLPSRQSRDAKVVYSIYFTQLRKAIKS